MSNILIRPQDINFDEFGRVVFVEPDIKKQLEEIWKTKADTTVNNTCNGNCPTTDGVCGGMVVNREDVLFPIDGGDDPMNPFTIDQDDFIKAMRRIKKDGVDTNLYVQTYIKTNE
jgi:hypothetical protein